MSPSTLAEDLWTACAERPQHTAVVDARRRVTYEQLLREAAGLATGLADLGVRRGDRVALVQQSGVEAAVALYGALLADAAIVPLDATSKVERLAHLLDHCGAAAVVCDATTVDVVRVAARAVPAPPHVVVAGPPQPGDLCMAELVALPPRAPGRLLDVDLATIVYTSGSTGTPKGVTYLHRNATFVSTAVIASLGLLPQDRVLSVLPFSHTYGLYQLLMAVRLGATVVLEPRGMLPGRLVRALEHETVTVLPGVPTLWQVLTSLHGLAERRLPLRVLTNAGAALSPAMLERVRRTFPDAELFCMYGQTECKRVCALEPGQLAGRPGSVGRPIPGTEAWLEDEHGREVGPGVVGELVVRGDHVMQGYWRDPDRTAQKLVPGRFPGDRVLRTGDLFRRDEDGYLYFVSRSDDVILTRGEKVAPLEVERVLCAAPGVREAAVIGCPDERLGQAVVAHVAAMPGVDVVPAQLRAWCAQHLEAVRVPRHVVLHGALPRLSNGKVDRMALLDGLVPR